jgi:putative ABC transport system substrate-binding protein
MAEEVRYCACCLSDSGCKSLSHSRYAVARGASSLARNIEAASVSNLLRRRLSFVLPLAAVWAAFGAHAQTPPRLPRIGVLYLPPASPADAARGFGQGLRELGYVDGRNVVIEWRHADGQPERLIGLANDLVLTKVDVILAGGPGPLVAARQATTTIPIVSVGGSDPVAEGWARSLSRPGGNVTGLVVTFPEVSQKRLELLKVALPGVVRVAVLLAPGELPGVRDELLDSMEVAARGLGLQLQVLEVRAPADFEPALRRAREGRAQALVTVDTGFVVSQRTVLAELAARERLPVVGEFTAFGADGLLMAYGADLNELLKRSASYVDRILKGARPGEMPIERPTKLDLTVNLKVARALNITFPKSLLLQAQRIIE